MENLVGDEQEEAEGMATTESTDMEINKKVQFSIFALKIIENLP